MFQYLLQFFRHLRAFNGDATDAEMILPRAESICVYYSEQVSHRRLYVITEAALL